MNESVETRILDAARHCCERWGIERVTIEDIATASGVSRATLYRFFPGGKDVLFEALQARERSDFFDALTAAAGDLDDLETTLVHLVVAATKALRTHEHLAVMLATEPGSALGHLTLDGLPRIIDVANDYLAPFLKPFLDPENAAVLIDVMTRLTISYFLAPSEHVDFGDPESTRRFLQPGLAAIKPPAHE